MDKQHHHDTRYILIDSSYRDRFQYPEPASFIIPFQKMMGNDIASSTDPTTSMYPVYNFQWATQWVPSGSGTVSPTDPSIFVGDIIGGSPRQPLLASSIDLLTGITNDLMNPSYTNATGVFRQLYFLYDYDGITSPIRPKDVADYYLVVEYDPVNRVITLDRAIPGFTVGVRYTLYNPSKNAETLSDGTVVPMKITLQGYNFDRLGTTSNNSGFFLSTSSSLFLLNLRTSEVIAVVYNGLDSVVSPVGFKSWVVTDAYLLFIDNAPRVFGRIIPIIGTRYYASGSIGSYELSKRGAVGCVYKYDDLLAAVIPGTPSGVPLGDAITYALFRITSVNSRGEIVSIEMIRPGLDYCCGGVFDLAVVGSVSPSLVLADDCPIDIRAQITVQTINTYMEVESTTAPTANSFFMPMINTPMFNKLKNEELCINPINSIPPNTPRTPIPTTQKDADQLYGAFPITRVFDLGGGTWGVQLSAQGAIFNEKFPRTSSELSRFSSFSPYSTFFTILEFRGDSCVPLNYSGSTVSSNQMVCYNMRIVSLILPNQLLQTAYGGLVSAYPFVFVDISNESAPTSHNKNTIYTNNPSAVNATFICNISDVNSPLITKYIKIFSDGTNNVVKFKPNDNLRFRVFLPSGETLRMQTADRLPPMQPNPLLQITCLLEITRIATSK